MKKIKIFALALSLGLLVGCAGNSSTASKDSPYAYSIVSANKILNFDKDDKIVNEDTSWKKAVRNELVYETKDKVLSIGQDINSPKNEIIALDKKTNEVKSKVIEDMSYNHYFDSEGNCYSASLHENYITFYKYDKDFNLVIEKNLENIPMLSVAINGITEYKDELYLLVTTSTVHINNTSDEAKKNNKVENEIWKMSKNFDLVEKTTLPINDTSAYRMLHDNNLLYIACTFKSKEEGGNQIVIYNLDTKDIKDITLKNSYPMIMKLDKENNRLIIAHEELYGFPGDISVLDLKTYEEKNIKLEPIKDKSYPFPYINMSSDKYYILIDTNLYKIDKKDLSFDKVDLSTYNLEFPQIIYFN